MCMFCAAVPAAAALGAKLNADQNKALRETQERGEISSPKPIAEATTGVVILLVVASTLYHAANPL